MSEPVVTRIGSGVYRVDVDGRSEIVYVAGTPAHRWVQWNGHVFEGPFDGAPTSRQRRQVEAHQSLEAPMPSTVRRIMVEPGASVAAGDTLLVLEAMKMELPIRAGSDAVVKRLLCREGELVQPGTTLIELE
ncbi:MAG: acetyl-CoA carboxylase biotin carboxyl carrier protein subunit [Vicinamibacterales bacterium]